MAVIRITEFGGLAPSVDARNLPPTGAQTANNLDLRFGDFRPVKGAGAAVTTVAAGVKSIFRTPSGVWLSSTNDANYVNGQINDAASERVYLTGRSAFPEAWQGGVYRRLGVPAPTAQPATTLVAIDEYTATDATVAQQAAAAAAKAVVAAQESPVLLGAAPPAGVVPVVATPDPLYADVQLHLQFATLLADSSPQRQTITNLGGVSLGVDNTGPLAASGGNYAQFSGSGLGGLLVQPSYGPERDEPWTVDVQYKSPVALEFIQLWASQGVLRKVEFVKAGGAVECLWCEYDLNGPGYQLQMRAKRANGSDICAANASIHLSIQNTGSFLQVFVDGVFVGRTPGSEGLRPTLIGRAWNDSAQGLTGKLDEFRVTRGARYDTGEAPASFTPSTTPFGTAAAPTGFWVSHGNALAVGLPTAATGDAAYMIQLSLSGGSYVATNVADEYLRRDELNGALVFYNGTPYWAVPLLNFQADGKSVSQAALQAALRVLSVPSVPGVPILTSAVADSLSAEIAAMYDTSKTPVSELVAAVNTAQANLRASLAAGLGGLDVAAKATVVAGLVTVLKSASTAAEAYFIARLAAAEVIFTTRASSIFGAALPDVVTRVIETRGYIVTFLTDWDEESAPSPPSALLELDQNDQVAVTASAPPPGRNIVAWKLYRSSTTNSGAAYQLVEDKNAVNAQLATDGTFRGFTVGNLAYTDAKAQGELQETCPTLSWEEPPTNLLGLVGLPNGIMAGFFGKTLCLSEPYAPYAWPVEYQQTLEYDIVGIGVFGQTAVILTKGNPYYASGADSASFSTQKMESPQACIAKRTIVPVEGGVVFASPDGLCLATPGGVQLFTQGVYSKVDWATAATANSFGAFHEGIYYLFT